MISSAISITRSYWHLVIPSERTSRTSFTKPVCGSNEGRMLIMDRDDDNYLGELLYFKGFDYQSAEVA